MIPRNLQQAIQPKQHEAELQHTIQTLKQELNFQVNANLRLSKELTECLKKLGIQKLDIIHQEQLLQFQTDMAYLAPLFLIYEEHIKNYDQMLENLIDDLRSMDAKIQIVNDDNNFLRKQLQEKDETLLKLYQHGTADNIKTVFNQLEHEDLEERIRLLNEENCIYIDKLKKYENNIYELQIHVDQIQKNENNYISQIHDLQQQNKQLEIQVDDLKVRSDVLDNKLKNQIQMAAISDEDKNEYIQRLGKSDNENKILKFQQVALKQEIEVLHTRVNQSKGELQKEIEELRLRERDSFDKQMYNEREIDALRDENRNIRKELDQTRSNLEQTIKMMENYENKVAVFQKKEENYKTINKQLKEEREAAMMEKDRYQLKEQQFDQTLQNLIMRQKEEQMNLKENNDKSNEQIKSRYRTIIEQREDEISRLNEENSSLNLMNERLSKENKSMKIEIQRMESNLKQDIEVNYQQADDMHRQINEFQEKTTLLEQKILDQDTEYSILKQQNESQMRGLQNNNADLRQALEHTRSALTSATQELSTMKSKTNQLGRNNQNLIEEVSKTKRHYEQRLEQIQDEYTYKIKNIQLQMEEALKREKQSRDRSVQLLQQYDSIEEKLKQEYSNRIAELEVTISNLKSMNHQLTLKLHEIKNSAQLQGEQYKNESIHHSTMRKT